MREYGWECGSLNLDLDLMEREANAFLGEHDFIDFCILETTASLRFVR